MRKMSVTQIPLLCMPVNNSQIEVGPASLTRKIESELRINISIRSIYEPSASPFAVRRHTRGPPHLQSSEEKHSKHPRALQAFNCRREAVQSSNSFWYRALYRQQYSFQFSFVQPQKDHLILKSFFTTWPLFLEQ